MGHRTRGFSDYDPERGMQGGLSVSRGEEVDSEVDDLRKKIGKLKQVSLDINEEFQLRNAIITEMESTIVNCQKALKAASKKLNKLYRESSANHLIVLICFVFAMFMGAYMWIRTSRVAAYVGVM